jgi:hydroxylamine reductase (hybrid-cluster protein)
VQAAEADVNIYVAFLFTTNCLMPVKPGYADRVFTTEVVSYPNVTHIGEDKDFTPVIEKALALGGYSKDKENIAIEEEKISKAKALETLEDYFEIDGTTYRFQVDLINEDESDALYAVKQEIQKNEVIEVPV